VDPAPAALSRPESRSLAATACAYGVLHHLGSLTSGLGGVGQTRWGDWIDLLTPYLVLLPAGVALLAAGIGPRLWIGYLAGAVLYADGHGIHLAANSIGNEAPGEPAHLWDEVVGHYLWYGGWTVVLAVLAATFARHRLPGGPVPYALALLVGGTAATNALEGGTVPLALAGVAAFGAVGWRTRDRLGRLLLVAALPTAVIVLGYGLAHGGFPQPSQLP
jgi:hypothetical protein